MKPLLLLSIILTHYVSVAEEKAFDARDLGQLKIENLAGPVFISASSESKAIVTYKKESWAKGCELKINKQFEVLSVIVEDNGKNSFTRQNCKVNFSLQVPEKTQIDVKNGSGDVKVSGVQGTIDFKLGSGDLKIDSTAPKVNGTAGSGDIEITGGVGSTSLRTGSGDIKIAYSNPIEEGLIDIKTGSGDAEISLPPTMKILTDFKAGSGAVDSEFGSDQAAKFKVSMRAGRGDLKIRKK